MSDAKDPRRLFDNRTLWLDRENMEIARERFWQAYRPLLLSEVEPAGLDKRTWNIAWAAAIAANSYIWEGNLGQPPEDEAC